MTTKQKRVEQALHESEQRYKQLLESVTDYIYTVTVEAGRAVATSHSHHCLAVTGYTMAEYEADPHLWYRMVYAEDRQAVTERAERLLRGEAVPSLEHRLIHKDGSVRWVRNTAVLHRDETGQVISYDGLISDITERKKTEAEMRKFFNVVEQTADLVVITDKNSIIEYVNPAFEKITGFSQAEALGKTPAMLQSGQHRREFYEKLTQVIHAGKSLQTIFINRRKNGELYYEDKIITPLKDHQGHVTHFVSTGRDITEQRQAQEALRERERQYRRRAAELQALYETSLRLNAQPETPELLYLIVEQVLPLLGAEAGALYIYDTTQNELICVVGVGYFSQRVGAMLKPGEGLTGQVFAARAPVKVADYQEWPNRVITYEDTSYPKATLGVPLLGTQGVLGVLNIGGGRQKTAFDEYDIWLAQLFAAQAAVALENARLHTETQRQAKELAALNQASRAIAATLDLNVVLDQMMVEFRNLFGADGASVLLHEEATNELVFAATVSSGSATLLGTRLPLDQGVAGHVIREKRPILIDNAQYIPYFYKQIDTISGITTRSLMAVPLISRQKVIGVVEVIHKAENAFSQRDLELLEALSSSAAIAIDNARLYEAEREQFRRLEQSQTRLVQIEKMAALGRLVASIAHEINNPLQAVQTCLTLAEEELAEEEKPRLEKLNQYLSIAGQEIERVATIVHRMRDFYSTARRRPTTSTSLEDFYRPIQTELQTIDLHTTLESVLQLANKQLQHHQVTVQLSWPADLPPIHGNSDHLKQVFLNLILNAVDAMAGEEGVLSIRASTTKLDHSRELRPDADSNHAQPAIRLEFSDTGAGMTPEVQARLFEPLFTTKEQGSGFGLYTSYKIIEAHGGQITVTSQKGTGTTFAILLPASQTLKVTPK
jgi:PAS domain S-box-containing protein